MVTGMDAKKIGPSKPEIGLFPSGAFRYHYKVMNEQRKFPVSRVMVSALAVVMLALATGVSAQTFPTTLELRFQNRLHTEAMRPDADVDREPGVNRALLRDYFHKTASKPPSGGYLSVGFNRFSGIERYEVSRLHVAMEAAEFGASMALFASAVGMSLGAWDEEMSWYAVSAAAAAGLLWGGTIRADDPKWRVRYRWEP